jgi:hypothetical protein
MAAWAAIREAERSDMVVVLAVPGWSDRLAVGNDGSKKP